jgi:DNA-binding beta-propeller fold protein YncE
MVVGSPIRVGPFPERISFDSANADLYVTNISTVTPSYANTPCAKTTTGLAPLRGFSP